VSLDDEPIEVAYTDIWPTLFNKISSEDNASHWITWTSIGPAGRTIPTGERENMLSVVSRNLNSKRLSLLNDLMPRLVIRIDYTSAYGEKFCTILTNTPSGTLDDLIAQAKAAEKRGNGF